MRIDFVKVIRNCFHILPNSIYSALVSNLLPDKIYLQLLYYMRLGRKLNLDNPQSFTEKIQWLKLYDRNPLYSRMVDKAEAKVYVTEKIGEEFIIPTLAVYDHFEDITFDSLPVQFVLKCTHNSGGLIVCKDKNRLDMAEAKSILEKQISTNYYFRGREWPYKSVKPRIIIEKYISSADGELKDYKFFCFNGEPRCLFITKGRPHNTHLNFYDLRLNKLPIQYVYPNYEEIEEIPASWDKMLEVARSLSVNIPFVRVDLYNINGHVLFGEMTFSPTGGFGRFEPVEWDYKLGEWLKLPEKKDG